MRQFIAFSLILAALVSLRAQADDAHSPSHAQQTAKYSLRSLGAQTELPAPKRVRVVEASEPPPAIPLEMAQVMLWAALAVLAAIVAYTIVDNLRPPVKSPAAHGKANPDELQAVRQRMGVARDAADVFAAGGNFAEAMHTLLLQSLDEMRRRLGVPIAVSLTSREILSRVALHSEAKSAFSDIIARVEISYFGDHAPGAEEYRQCRHNYSILSGYLRGGGGDG